MRHDSFRLLADIARRLHQEPNRVIPELSNIQELRKYLVFYNRQYSDSRGIHLEYLLGWGNGRLAFHVDPRGLFTFQLFCPLQCPFKASVFTLTISDGVVTGASIDQRGLEQVEDGVQLFRAVIEYVIPALGGFDDILKVTDESTMRILKWTGAAYAQEELGRLMTAGAEAKHVDAMQQFLHECLNLRTKYMAAAEHRLSV